MRLVLIEIQFFQYVDNGWINLLDSCFIENENRQDMIYLPTNVHI